MHINQDPAAVIQSFADMCGHAGVDIICPFAVQAWNVAADPVHRLPTFGRESTLGLLVGNSRKLWDALKERVAMQPALLHAANPLDDYVTEIVSRAVDALSLRNEVRFAHVLEPGPIPIQRIAAAAGLAALSPSHLSVHPEFGPWIALRAVVVLDLEAPAEIATSPRVEPCRSCHAPCMPHFRSALSGRDARLVHIPEEWRTWLGVRDACPVGREYRYNDAQIQFHYAKRKGALAE